MTCQTKDYKSDLKPIWCPGCGDFGVVQAIYRALAAIGRPPHEIAFVSGIGCSSRIPGYTTAYPYYRFPRIHKQNQAYLVAALTAYRNGERSHPTMRAQGESLTDQDIADIAVYLSTK